MNRPSRNLFKSSLLILAVLCLFLAQLALPASRAAHTDDASLVSTATPEGRLAVFDDLWETIRGPLLRSRFQRCRLAGQARFVSTRGSKSRQHARVLRTDATDDRVAARRAHACLFAG